MSYFKALYWQQPINMSTLVNFIRMFPGYFIEIRTYPEPANKHLQTRETKSSDPQEYGW